MELISRMRRIITVSFISKNAWVLEEHYAMIIVTIRDCNDITIVEMSSLSVYKFFTLAHKDYLDYVVINHGEEKTFFSICVQQ